MKLTARVLAFSLLFLPAAFTFSQEQKTTPSINATQVHELSKALDYLRGVLRTGQFTSDELSRMHAACERITGIKGKGVIFTQGLYLPDFKALKKDFRAWIRVRNALERRLFTERAGDEESKDGKPRQ